jgi:hypothetical protein
MARHRLFHRLRTFPWPHHQNPWRVPSLTIPTYMRATIFAAIVLHEVKKCLGVFWLIDCRLMLLSAPFVVGICFPSRISFRMYHADILCDHTIETYCWLLFSNPQLRCLSLSFAGGFCCVVIVSGWWRGGVVWVMDNERKRWTDEVDKKFS